MKRTRSITFMAVFLFVVSATMYCIASHEAMTEKQLATEMTKALEEDREAATLADALKIEAHYRARVEVKP